MSSPNGVATKPPLLSINNNNHSGYIVLTIYIAFFVALAFWVTRLTIRWKVFRFKWDDLFLLLALGFALIQSVCLQLAVNEGLGKRGPANLRRFEKVGRERGIGI